MTDYHLYADILSTFRGLTPYVQVTLGLCAMGSFLGLCYFVSEIFIALCSAVRRQSPVRDVVIYPETVVR